jgi:uncharacterized membrane protein
MNLQQSAEIRAGSQSVWATLTDVERWPEWTRSVERVERLDGGELGIGSRVRVRQPRVPDAVYTVTEFQPGRSFTWVGESFGIRSSAGHVVGPDRDGAVSVTLSFAQTGWLAWLVRSRAEKIAREYLAMEAEGLKRRCEG